MALNTKLYCPGCGSFLLKVERAVAFHMSCDRCHQDIEFARQPIQAQITPGGRKLKPRMIVWFPDYVDETA